MVLLFGPCRVVAVHDNDDEIAANSGGHDDVVG